MNTFHGSYNAGDVTFLLSPSTVNGENLERLSQIEGPLKFATNIASEAPMPGVYMQMYMAALERHKRRIAHDVAQVARMLAANAKTDEIVVTSLVRAGTPIGVLVHRALTMLGQKSVHYSISATRKRGSDPSAIDHILKNHRAESIVFIDGWTGKGYIAGELAEAMHGYNTTRGVNVDPALVVLADLAGVSSVAASADDYLIPAAMLRSTVCGLISASMINPEGESNGSPDACLYYDYLLPFDQSKRFVDVVSAELWDELNQQRNQPVRHWTDADRRQARIVSDRFVEQVMSAYGLTDRNAVKPGICEANRALLTRKTEMKLIVRDPGADAADLENLFFLAEGKGVPVEVNNNLPYRAAVILG